jgi:hypothetical protein
MRPHRLRDARGGIDPGHTMTKSEDVRRPLPLDGGLRRARRRLFFPILLLAATMMGTAVSAGGDPGCDAQERKGFLATEQRDVLELLRSQPGRDLTVLRDEGDLSALAALGYDGYDHYFVSFAGQGLAIIDFTREPKPGNPFFLLYSPSAEASDVTDIDGPDFPYSLAGWGYVVFPYNALEPPTALGDCVGRGDWFVHERGIHPADTGGMYSVPPHEDHHGQASGESFPMPGVDGPVGLPHPRAWDIHFWLGSDGVPSISILNPGPCIPGMPSDVGVAWFHPDNDRTEVGREQCAG